MENASGAAPLMASARGTVWGALRRPGAFLTSRPFALVFMLYSSTYLTANSIDTLSATLHARPPHTVTAGPGKFAATSTTNMALCLVKDRAFARMFATITPRPIPLPTYLLFAARDSLTIFASFNLPAMLAPHFPRSTDRYVARADVAQFVCPAAVQLFSTPLHLWGLDLYNRAGPAVKWTDRLAKVGRDWAVSCAARIVRILPAFGVGGVVNTKVRRRLMGRLEEGG
ncbi:MAG: hypothetical protein M1813_002436 [Trichoglossum hirsutum]|nr:MAG: hypothetical protein M1813_002436 [Trichoglossum hirsutum]